MILHTIESGIGPPVVLLHGLFGAARNFGAVQRALAPQFRVIALDMRNHGDSPHGADMRYATQATDVEQTLGALGVGQAAVVGHSMGGKAAMALALASPRMVGRLLVSDIAPVVYQHGNAAMAAAMRSIVLTPTLTRQQADAALAPAVPRPDIRAFLLQNLRFGAEPHWRIGLREIAASIADLEGWPASAADPATRERVDPAVRPSNQSAQMAAPGLAMTAGEGSCYPGPTLFVTGGNSDYVRAEHRPIIRTLFPAARFVAVKHAGHWVHADNPAGFLSVLEAFLHDWK
ncbi:alpha/beta fold hydrolase [Rhodopila sp.]|uniref:alpha/beta fold hydrolase n=1 Tax=Rhodopila sp. TaxID=2480087 RepID=UPI003D0A3900